MNERINPSDNRPTDEINSTPTTYTSDSIDLTDNNETESNSGDPPNESNLSFDPGDPPDESNLSFDPGDDSMDEDMESKYDDEQEPTDQPTNEPVAGEVRKLQQLLAPINPKYTQPTIATNDAPHTRSGRVIRSSHQSPPIQTIIIQPICIMHLLI